MEPGNWNIMNLVNMLKINNVILRTVKDDKP